MKIKNALPFHEFHQWLTPKANDIRDFFCNTGLADILRNKWKIICNSFSFSGNKRIIMTFCVKHYFFILGVLKKIFMSETFSDRKHILKRFNILCDIKIRMYIGNVQIMKPQKSFLLCEIFLCYFLKDECFRAWVSPAPGVDMITAGNGF